MLKSLNMETPAKLAERSKRALMMAIRLCGSTKNLAKKIGITKQRLNYWKSGTNLMHYDIAVKIFIATEGLVSLYDLRPDLADTTRKLMEIGNLCLLNKKNNNP